MTNEQYLRSHGYKGKVVDDKFLENAIECYYAYLGKDKVEVILAYAELKRKKLSEPQK